MASTSNQSSSAARVALERNGRRVELNISQLTTENLRKIFQVNPSETWLKNDCDGTAYFPETEDGRFNLQNISPYVTLVVEGPTVSGFTSARNFSGRGQSVIPASPLPTPIYRSVTAPKKLTFTIKVVKATMCIPKKGIKPEFQSLNQMYIELSESTANVGFVTEAIKKQWGSEYIIVTIDGLEIDDSSATQGIAFWRSPRRKLFAVNVKDAKECGRVHHRRLSSFVEADSSDNESDSEHVHRPTNKKRKFNEKSLEELTDDVAFIKDTLTDMMTLNAESKLPMGLKRMLRDTFKCHICHSIPAKPPLIITKCCKNMLGCEACVNQWYSGPEAMTKTCPICRAERGCNETMLLRGLTEFLEHVGRLEEDTAVNSHGREQVEADEH